MGNFLEKKEDNFTTFLGLGINKEEKVVNDKN